jgi:hypothetical protein
LKTPRQGLLYRHAERKGRDLAAKAVAAGNVEARVPFRFRCFGVIGDKYKVRWLRFALRLLRWRLKLWRRQ